jgi:ferredoxin-NADP reductase
MAVPTQAPVLTDGPGARTVVVEALHRPGPDVLVLTLADPHSAALPAWEPGAHIDVQFPGRAARQYSLCGDPDDRARYRLAVLRGPDPGGMSRWLHAGAVVGTTLRISAPRNRFALQDAPRYLFLAGGIGITPILPMVAAACRPGRPWRLSYGARSRHRLVFADEIGALVGGRLDLVAEDEHGPLDIDTLVRECAPDADVYACGPGAMLQAVQDACRRWRPDRPPAIERFSAAAPAMPAVDAARAPAGRPAPAGRRAFDVELRRSGITVTVPANRSLLSVIREVLPDTPFSCGEGVCGTCETSVLAGVPEHHDEVLTEAERAEGATMMICVGRAAPPLLVLDL